MTLFHQILALILIINGGSEEMKDHKNEHQKELNVTLNDDTFQEQSDEIYHFDDKNKLVSSSSESIIF